MLSRVLPFALVAVMGFALPAAGQGRVAGPAEAPPAGFTGAQYIDSRGCAFMRAGHDGQVQWVARIGANRRPVCGQVPTRTAMAQARRALDSAETAAAPSPAPAAVPPAPATAPAPVRGAVGQPMQTVATTTTPPRISAAPAAGRPAIPATQYAAPRVAAAPAPVRAAGGCPAHAPERQVFDRIGGGSVAFCTVAGATVGGTRPGDAALRRALREAGGVAPRAAPAAAVPAVVAPVRQVAEARPARSSRVCPQNAPVRQVFDRVGGGVIVFCTATGLSITGARPGDEALRRALREAGGIVPGTAPGTAAPGTVVAAAGGSTGFTIPEGYKAAWTDDRLNPHRARGTAAGQAAMERVWTNDVPQRLVASAPAAAEVRQRATTSSRGQAAPSAEPAGAGSYVQVGSFGVPANAEGAAQRLRGMGLPVRVGQARIGGKPVQVVMAGPFAEPQQAASALASARQAGFGDAFVRR